MTHDDWADRVEDYVDGALTPEETKAFEEHLAGCDECRKHAALLRILHDCGSELSDDLTHPTPGELISYALGRMQDKDLALAITEHIGKCDQCAKDVADAKFIIPEPDGSNVWRRFLESLRFPKPLMTYAAAMLALILIYPAYLGLRTPRSTVGDLGIVGVSTFAQQGTTRSASGDMKPFVISRQQPFFHLVLHHQSTRTDFRSDDIIVLKLIDLDSHQEIRSSSLPYDKILDPRIGAISLMIPTDDLASGRYRMTAARLDDKTPFNSLDFSLVIEN